MVTFEELRSGTATLAVVGLGYVGLPLAVAFARQMNVLGFDISSRRIEELRNGLDRTREVDNADLQTARLRRKPAQGLRGGLRIHGLSRPH